MALMHRDRHGRCSGMELQLWKGCSTHIIHDVRGDLYRMWLSRDEGEHGGSEGRVAEPKYLPHAFYRCKIVARNPLCFFE